MRTDFIVRRLILLVFVLVGVAVITFTISHLIPADPARYAAGLNATAEQVERLRHEMGLDRPAVEQFMRYVGNLLQGDLGTSISSRQPVAKELSVYLPATLELVILAYVIMVGIGVPLGMLSAVYKGTWIDYFTRIPVIVGTGLPIFWIALMGQLFLYYRWDILPFGGRLGSLSAAPPPVTGFYLIDSLLAGNFSLFGETAVHLVLPAVVLALSRMTVIARLTRASMLETLNQDFIRTARSKGLKERTIVVRHALRVAFLPVLTELGLEFGWMLAGTIVIESIFAWPGIGRYAFTAIQYHDLAAIMGVTLVLTFFKIASNFIVDILYVVIDPRIRY